MAFIILGIYRNMGNVPSAAAAAGKAGEGLVLKRPVWPGPRGAPTQPPPPAARPPAKPENTRNINSKKADTLPSFHTMRVGLQSTINALIKRDGDTSKNFVLLEFRNGINGNNNLTGQLELFKKLILDPTYNEVAAQRKETFDKSRSIKRVRIWTGMENKQFPALALQGVFDGYRGLYPGLFRHFFRENGTDTNSLLMVASASDEYNFWKYNESRNIGMNNREKFDTIVLLCIISPNSDTTYDLDRSALETRGTSLYNGLLNAASNTNSRFRMLAYKTKAEVTDLGDASVNVPTDLAPSKFVELAYRNAVAGLAPRNAAVADSERDDRAIAAAAVEVFLAVVACAVDALTANRAPPPPPPRTSASPSSLTARASHTPPAKVRTSTRPSAPATPHEAAVDAIQEFRNLNGKLETNLVTEGKLEQYMSSVLNILIELTGGRGTFDARNKMIQETIPERFHDPYMTTIANTATPMLLSLLKVKSIKPANEVELLIVLRNLTSASHINITEDKLSDTINILLEKVNAPENDRLEFVLGILYNMTFMPDGNEAVKKGMLSEAGEAVKKGVLSEAGEAVKKGGLSAAGGAIMNIANSKVESQLKTLAQRILKNTGLATTGGSRRIKKRKIESTRRRHKKHGR